MRVCPRCGSIYAAQTAFCGIDGEKLVEQDQDPLIGKTVDRYRIDERLGTGAMGVVYRAAHTVLEDREYAVKVLFGDFASDGRLVARFRREAQAASKIHHENIVEVVDFGTADSGLSFLVMELVEGENLSDVIEREAPMSSRRVARIARSIAAGLGEAHRLGFVHRDLKPANIMLTKDAEGEEIGKVMDFGVVGAIEADDSTKLTRTGTIVGTPLYMAPEQAQGDPATPASDIYALGVIVFEMLSGQPPFRGDSLRKVVMAHLTEPPPPLPPSGGLESLVPSLMQKQPSRRPGRADQVVAEIDRILESMTGEERVSHDILDAVIVDGLRQLGGRGDSSSRASPTATTKIQAAVRIPDVTTPSRIPPTPARVPSPAPRGGSPVPRGGSPVPRGASPLPRSASGLPPLPVMAPLPPLEQMARSPSGPGGRPPVVESPFTGGPTNPMAVRGVEDSYPDLRIERRQQRRGRAIAFLLVAAGLGTLAYVWRDKLLGETPAPRKVGELAAQYSPSADAETSGAAETPKGEKKKSNKKSKPVSVTTDLQKLEDQLLRMLASRRLSIPDLQRFSETAQLTGRWQQFRREGSPLRAQEAVAELIDALRSEKVAHGLLEAKLGSISRSIGATPGLSSQERSDLERRHAELIASLQNSRDERQVRALAPAIADLEEAVVKAAQPKP